MESLKAFFRGFFFLTRRRPPLFEGQPAVALSLAALAVLFFLAADETVAMVDKGGGRIFLTLLGAFLVSATAGTYLLILSLLEGRMSLRYFWERGKQAPSRRAEREELWAIYEAIDAQLLSIAKAVAQMEQQPRPDDSKRRGLKRYFYTLRSLGQWASGYFVEGFGIYIGRAQKELGLK